MFFTKVNPMDDDHGMEETACDLNNPRITPHKNTWKPHQNSVLLQFEARSEERIAILSNTVTCNRPPQHTACSLHWESGMRENEGGAIPQGIVNPRIATCCTQSEFAQWSTRSAGTRRKDILWPTKRIAGLRGNLVQQRWLQNTRHTPFSWCSCPAPGHGPARPKPRPPGPDSPGPDRPGPA